MYKHSKRKIINKKHLKIFLMKINVVYKLIDFQLLDNLKLCSLT
jgi:hypothetical protein